MKKTITSALLTLGLVGFANAAPPAATKPESVPVKVETVDSLKAEVEALKKERDTLQRDNMILKAENQSMKQRLKKPKPSKSTATAVSIKRGIQEAYLKEFDTNKDGKVSISERPDRDETSAFYKKMHKKNYPHLYREDGTRTNQPVKKSK